jgi:hypothetical protein
MTIDDMIVLTALIIPFGLVFFLRVTGGQHDR